MTTLATIHQPPFLINLVIAIVAMAAKDCVGTLMVVAESKGNERLAGHMDALGDLAQIACQVVGAGSVILNGLTWKSAAIITAMVITSDIGTAYWTHVSKRIKSSSPSNDDLLLRIQTLEKAIGLG